jgi:iron complex outermembrane recepter protein
MKTRTVHKLLAGAALVLTFCSSSPGFAQENAADGEADKAAAQDSGQPGQDIVVTARLRAENLQDVPVSVSAFSEQALEAQQVRSLEDLNFGAPNFNVVKNVSTTNAAQIYIRGLGQDESTFHAEQPVAVYIDGVPLGKANGALLDLIEFERIEVLRGPQGTLYGRNSAGGAVKFISRRPDLDDSRVVADATIGSYERVDFRASASAPIIAGKLAAKLDIVSRTDDGYVTNLTNGQSVNTTDRQTARLALLWAPTDATRLYVTADHTWDNSSINLAVPFVVQNGRPVDLYGPFASRTARPDLNRYRGWGTSAELTHDLGFASLMSLTSYRKFTSILSADLDGREATSLDFEQRLNQNQFTQEFQLTSNGDGPLNYVVGAFYFREVVRQFADNILQNTLNNNRQVSENVALFGEITYDLTPTLSVSAGGRYTWDDKTMRVSANNRVTRAELFNERPDFSSSQFTPRVTVNWDATDDIMIYGSWSRGYQSGGFANGRPTTRAQALATFEPQTVSAFEGGAKLQFFDRRVRWNTALFHNDFKNIGFSFLNGTQLQIATANVRIRGFESEMVFSLLPGLNAYFNYGYLDGKYTKLPINPTTGAVTVNGLTLNNKLKHVPEHSFKVGGEYSFDLGNSARMGIGGNYAYGSRIFRNLANSPAIVSPATGFLDAQVWVETADSRWRVTFAGRNLTDEIYPYQGVSGFTRYFLMPATWSLTVRAAF